VTFIGARSPSQAPVPYSDNHNILLTNLIHKDTVRNWVYICTKNVFCVNCVQKIEKISTVKTRLLFIMANFFLWGNNTLMGFPVLKPGETFHFRRYLPLQKSFFLRMQGLFFRFSTKKWLFFLCKYPILLTITQIHNCTHA